MSVLGGLLKELAFAAGRGVVTGVGKLLRRQSKPPEPPHVTYRDVEHQRAQAASATSFKVVKKKEPDENQ